MENKALILVAHGSRKSSSNEEVKALGEQIKALKHDEYAIVMTSFLEFSEPTLQECLLDSIDKGMKEIIILPYFLASGHHVTRDIPEIIQTIQSAHPENKIILKPHLGSSPQMAKLLSDMVE